MPVAAEHAAGGPFFFALSDIDEPDFLEEHERYDEYVFSFALEQSEGDFATLGVDIKNPYKGLYAPGQKIYCWFAYDNGSEVVPLFRGRMIGLPSDLLGEVVTVQFTARPEDYADQKADLADDMRVLPFYDDVFVDVQQRRSNPDVVLQGYSKLWHSDRITHEVTASEIIVGEDGTLVFDDNLYDGVKVELEGRPLSAVAVDGSVNWHQQYSGNMVLGPYRIESYTAANLASSWPKPDAKGGGSGTGYFIESGTGYTLTNENVPMVTWQRSYQNHQKTHNDGDVMSVQESFSGPVTTTAHLKITITKGTTTVIGDPFTGTPASASRFETAVIIGGTGVFNGAINVGYNADFQREEHAKITLVADIQPVLQIDSTEDEGGPEAINGADVGIALDDDDSTTSDDEIPLDSLARAQYFPTERGLQSLEHLIYRARAKLLFAARAARVSWDVPFNDMLEVTCRKNAVLHDPRIAGGEALGKIVSYRMQGEGDSGQYIGNVRIGCAVGNATAIEDDAGSCDYIADDYIESGYYSRVGEIVLLSSGDIGYAPPVYARQGDLVFPLTPAQVVISQGFTNGVAEQTAAVEDVQSRTLYDRNAAFEAAQQAMVQEIVKAIARTKTTFNATISPCTGGPLVYEYDIATTVLTIPKQIDLSAVP